MASSTRSAWAGVVGWAMAMRRTSARRGSSRGCAACEPVRWKQVVGTAWCWPPAVPSTLLAWEHLGSLGTATRKTS
eukprot:6499965-Prymnesium_polylepis.1